MKRPLIALVVWLSIAPVSAEGPRPVINFVTPDVVGGTLVIYGDRLDRPRDVRIAGFPTVIRSVSSRVLVVDLSLAARIPGTYLLNVRRLTGETTSFTFTIGVKGPTGDRGAEGESPRGPTGPQGPKGDRGDPAPPLLRPDGGCFDNASRYVNCGNGTVTDVFSGLVWMQSADCIGSSNWPDAQRAAAALKEGDCNLTDGSQAGDWRLPTNGEWAAMIALARSMGCFNPSLTNDAGTACYGDEPGSFTGVTSTPRYWSSTGDVLLASRARFIDLSVARPGVAPKTDVAGVWVVRGLAR
jgi:hypothetical protein